MNVHLPSRPEYVHQCLAQGRISGLFSVRVSWKKELMRFAERRAWKYETDQCFFLSNYFLIIGLFEPHF